MIKRLLISLLAATMLFGVVSASNAVALTIWVNATPPATNDWSAGVDTNAGGTVFTNFFLAENGGLPFAYALPSVIKFGDTLTAGPLSGVGTFSAVPAEFTFDAALGDQTASPAPTAGAHHFSVVGELNGSVGYDGTTPFSRATVTFSSLVDETAGIGAGLTTNPNNGLPALLVNTEIGGQALGIWLNQIQDIAAPSAQTTSITGYANVPEPNSVALLFAAGVSGTLFCFRRRRS